MADNPSLDFYTLRFFLYKYNPKFTKTTDGDIQTQQTGEDQTTTPISKSDNKDAKDENRLSRIDRYEFDLIDVEGASRDAGPLRGPIFTKYDITRFVSNYTFNQTLNENTFTWSVSLQNSLIPLKLLKEIRIEGTPSDENEMIRRLSETEAQARDVSDDLSIHVAKINRGLNETANFIRKDNNKPKLIILDKDNRQFLINDIDKEFSILLSDLIQPYDMVSMFLYKKDVPIQDITGTLDKKTGLFQIDISKNPLTRSRTKLIDNLTDERVLRSPDNTVGDSTRSIFTNEFNGFVQDKIVNISTGQVDTVNISGNGITHLFGVTRRVIKSSVFQKSLYDSLESGSQDAFTALQNIYAGRPIREIFTDLFALFYKIKPALARQVLSKTAKSFPKNKTFTSLPSSLPLDTDLVFESVERPGEFFYDISAIEVANKFGTNPFSIPPYLLALVMKRHGFCVRHTTNPSVAGKLQEQIIAASKSRAKKKAASNSTVEQTGDKIVQGKTEKSKDESLIDQAIVDSVLNKKDPDLQEETGTRSPVFFSSELDQLIPYFKHFEAVLKDWSPEMKTPFEIIDEIKAKTFLEFFERPDGTIYIRPPEYNDVTHTINSSTLDVINATYIETSTGIITRQQVGYAADAVPTLAGLQSFAYTNGKLLAQYGHMEAMADANPNAKNIKSDDEKAFNTIKGGVTRYAEYLLRLHNAALKTGTIVCGYDARIMVGKTYFDERNNKFGYITSVSKSVATGGLSSITMNLAYVRDAWFDADPEVNTIQFEHLDRLVDLAKEFNSTNKKESKATDPEKAPEGTGKTTTLPAPISTVLPPSTSFAVDTSTRTTRTPDVTP